MIEEPKRPGLGWLLAGKAACCGALLLVVSGAFSLGGLATWFAEGGYLWLGGAIVALAAVFALVASRHRAEPLSPREHDGGARRAGGKS